MPRKIKAKESKNGGKSRKRNKRVERKKEQVKVGVEFNLYIYVCMYVMYACIYIFSLASHCPSLWFSLFPTLFLIASLPLTFLNSQTDP